MKKFIVYLLTPALLVSLCLSGCGEMDTPETETTAPGSAPAQTEAAGQETETAGPAQEEKPLTKIDMTKWQYAGEDDVYWQVGIAYCEKPLNAEYETMGFYVPGAYFDAEDNGDGTYTCTVNPEGTVGGYTARSAPVILPVDTPGYRAMKAPAGYSGFGYGDIKDYTDAGFVLAVAGARGRESGAPAGVTDFKAAIRYTRFNADVLPGNMDAIFTEGMSGGGAQSTLLGATGDSALYDPYLEQIGAVMDTSDAVLGSMAWCPITNLDEADAAYEWNMGITRTELSEQEQQISDALAASYADYINSLGLRDENGNVLTLEASERGIFQAGSYYERIRSEIETSLNHFLEDTTFPLKISGVRHENNDSPDDGISRTEVSGKISVVGTFETPADYVEALNQNGEWVHYDAGTNTVSITSVSAFAMALKQASKSLGAFDQLDGRQGENTLFGYGDGKGAHFDLTLGELLEDLGLEEADDFARDFAREDDLGNTVETRVNMYTPLYYLLASQDGYQTSSVASYWRIRTGINQGDTALCTEVNLALALESYDGVQSVDFAMVWGKAHVQAERTGTDIANFIEWVNSCMQAQ